ncbi:MAG: hypothetical protein IPK60_24135 [Sandaracinaceae bacterium]|nr:hypothetical protein [Sandaracinaceae bacterium]
MATDDTKKERRLPLPVVLAAASVMVSVGIVAYFMRGAPANDGESLVMQQPLHVTVDTSTPERSAESFLDAWRKRAHADAIRLSVGPARDRAEHRRAAEEEMLEEDRVMADAVWRQMADMRLTLRINQSERVSDTKLILRGRAEGEFLKRPYLRDAVFTMERRGQDWLVANFDFGDAPERDVNLRLPDGGLLIEPGHFDIRPPPP